MQKHDKHSVSELRQLAVRWCDTIIKHYCDTSGEFAQCVLSISATGTAVPLGEPTREPSLEPEIIFNTKRSVKLYKITSESVFEAVKCTICFRCAEGPKFFFKGVFRCNSEGYSSPTLVTHCVVPGGFGTGIVLRNEGHWVCLSAVSLSLEPYLIFKSLPGWMLTLAHIYSKRQDDLARTGAHIIKTNSEITRRMAADDVTDEKVRILGNFLDASNEPDGGGSCQIM